jgi:hypothetical protein
MKTYGGCPAMPSPGSARIAESKMGLGINDPIADLGFRISDCFDLRFSSPSLETQSVMGGDKGRVVR